MNNISKAKVHNNILKSGSKNLNAENWKVFHPNGRHMFTCGEKKAIWYIERKLAKVTGDMQIMLTFIPKGNGFEDNEIFGRSSRESICVVSGLSSGLQRHHIVPYCYRTYFPEEYKSKNHHDVVLINYKKHSEYEMKANLFKDEIADIYGVKTIGELNLEYTRNLRNIGKENGIVKNAIHSIFKSHGKMSNENILEKLAFIAEKTNIDFETICSYNYFQLYRIYQYLQELYEEDVLEFKSASRKLYDHGYYVMQKLDTEEKIEDFVKLWRNHFIDSMHPKYMPIGWSVDFRIKTKL